MRGKTRRKPLLEGRHKRLIVTDAHLQQKKYEVNNPKVSSPKMWLPYTNGARDQRRLYIDEMSLWVVDFLFLMLKVCIGDW